MLGTSPESGALIARYLGADSVRLSPAALETLAIIAYRQPVTRGVIERIRGVDSGHVVRGLLHRRLVTEQGRAESPGRPILYGTSMEFMERFGLTSLDDLPPIEAEIAAQLAQAEEDVEDRGRAGLDEAVAPAGTRPRPRMAETIRVQKALADAGVASRRGADALVAAGRVTVNGLAAVTGQRLDPRVDALAVDGRPVVPAGRRTYLVLHKPPGVTSTVSDRHAEQTVLDLVPAELRRAGTRLYPVGRLDKDSEGLILLTDDGDWTQHLLHPRYGVEREYAVGLRRPLDAAQARALEDGIALDEGVATLVSMRQATRTEASRIERPGDPADALYWYRAVLTQGWKRQLRRMFAAVSAPVERLVRVRIGTLRLDDLAPGDVRPLTSAERERLASHAERPLSGLRVALDGPGSSGKSSVGAAAAGRSATASSTRACSTAPSPCSASCVTSTPIPRRSWSRWCRRSSWSPTLTVPCGGRRSPART